MTGATSGTGMAYPSGAPDFLVGLILLVLLFQEMYCG